MLLGINVQIIILYTYYLWTYMFLRQDIIQEKVINSEHTRIPDFRAASISYIDGMTKEISLILEKKTFFREKRKSTESREIYKFQFYIQNSQVNLEKFRIEKFLKNGATK